MSTQNNNRAILQRAIQALQKTRQKLEALEYAQHEPIAIIGISCRFPGAHSPEEFWELLTNSIDAITETPFERFIDANEYRDLDEFTRDCMRYGGYLDSVDQFDPLFFGMSPREATYTDPQQRILLEVAWEALERAGIAVDKLKHSQTGVFVGVTNIDYAYHIHRAGVFREIGTLGLIGNVLNGLAGRLSYTLGLMGPCMAIDTACSSSLVAAHLACQSLRNNECKMALAAGVNLILRMNGLVTGAQAYALSPDGRCKTFDASANGYVRGEGAGVVVLKRLSDALADSDNILAVIRGSAVNQDGASSGITTPNGRAQQAVIRHACKRSNTEPSEITYVEVHGTGTPLGDPIEAGALAEVFANQKQPLYVGSVKTNFGHLESAAGIAGLIKVVLSLQHNTIPANLHLHHLNPQIDWSRLPFVIPQKSTPWHVANKVAGISSFGGSGTIAHMIVEEAPSLERQTNHVERPAHILTISAQNERALEQLVRHYLNYMRNEPMTCLGDICYTANVGRKHLTYRLTMRADSVTQMRQRLAAFCDEQATIGMTQGHVPTYQLAPKIAFLFTGQGSQYVGMGRQLYESQPAFRQTLEQCDEYLRQFDVPLLSVLYPEGESEEHGLLEKTSVAIEHGLLEKTARGHAVDETTYTQPALFALEYALVQLWRAWGIEPDVVMGHSVGEYVAACVAGVFSLEDALKLIAARGRLMGALPQNGAMVSVMADSARIEQATACPLGIAPFADVSIAAINGPESVVISGEREAVMAIAEQLAAKGIKTRQLTVSHAFHSPLMEPMLDEFRQVAERITYHKPKLPLVSNVTGKVVTDDVTTPEYWVRHVRDTVRFADGVKSLYQQDVEILLEVGPKATLLGMAKMSDKTARITYLPSLRENRNDWQQMLTTLGELYVRGTQVDWEGFDKDYQRRKVVLPTYPFQRKRYWVESKPHAESTHLSRLIDRLIQLPRQKEVIYETNFSVARLPFLADHVIFGEMVSSGTCQLAMVLEAAQLAYREQTIQLVDVILPQALLFADDKDERTVQVVFGSGLSRGTRESLTLPGTLSNSASTTFEVMSFIANVDVGAAEYANETLRTHASGTLRVIPATAQVPAVDIALVRTRCRAALDFELLKAFWEASQFQFGPTYLWLDKIWYGQGEVIGRLRLPEAVNKLDAHQLHPGLLDASLQLTLTFKLLEKDAEGLRENTETRLPFGFDAVTLFGELTSNEEWWCYAQLVDGQRWRVQLLDTAGTVLMQIEGLNERSASRQHVLGIEVWRDWLYQVEWQRSPDFSLLPDDLPAPAEQGGFWRTEHNGDKYQTLIFADAQGMGEALASQLQDVGETPILIYAGQSYQQIDPYTFTIQPNAAEDYRRILTAFPTPHRIVHLWSLGLSRGTRDTPYLKDGIDPSTSSGQRLVDASRQSCGTVLLLVQALLHEEVKPAALYLVTSDAQAVTEKDTTSGVVQSALWGMGKVIALEHPELNCGLVDLPATSTLRVDEQAAQLCVEMTKAGRDQQREEQVALRHDGRYVARLARYQTAKGLPITHTQAIQAEATYLITGGLGGLGLVMAQWLAEQGARHLLLVGRSQPKPEAQPQLDGLREMGVTVTVAQADVTVLSQLQAVLGEVDKRYPLRGVIHSVGVLDDGSLFQQNWDRFEKVLAPKMQGSIHLHQLTKEMPLDFFVLFSSAASLLGNRGQANYVAANAFLDAFASYRRACGLPALSINWGTWSKVGVAVELVRSGQVAARGHGVISPHQGVDALAYLLAHAPHASQVGVMPIHWTKFLHHNTTTSPFYQAFKQLEGNRKGLPLPEGNRKGLPLPGTLSVDIRQKLASAPESERHALLITYLRAAAAKVLGLESEQIDPQQGLVEIGLDSLMAIELRNQVQKELAIELRVTTYLDNSSIVQLVKQIEEKYLIFEEDTVSSPSSAASQSGFDTHSVPSGHKTTPATKTGKMRVIQSQTQRADASKKQEIADWFYRPSWERSPLPFLRQDKPISPQSESSGLGSPSPSIGRGVRGEGRSVLLFVDEYGLGDQLAKRLKKEGQDVMTVRVGSGFTKLDDQTYLLNPERRDEYEALVQDILKQGKRLSMIVHLWRVTRLVPRDEGTASHSTLRQAFRSIVRRRAASRSSVKTEPEQAIPKGHAVTLHSTEAGLQLGFYSLLFLAQALGSTTEQIQLMVVTNNMEDVTGEEVLCPEKATILGPVKVIPQEYPNISTRSVDVMVLDKACPEGRGISADSIVVNQLLAELNSSLSGFKSNHKTPSQVIAYRGRYRWQQTFKPVRASRSSVRLRKTEPTKSLIREGGVYLITGGLGGIGLVLAEELASKSAKLILTGRSAFPEPEKWAEWLATHDENDQVSHKIRKVQALEELGAQVLVIRADVANQKQMEAVINQAKKTFGQLNGVIHAAGAVKESFRLIQEISPTECQNQFRPKVDGLLVLEKVLQGQALDFCVLLSSLSSVLGGLGFVAYSAANLFMDAFTHLHNAKMAHNRESATRWLSVNWDSWQLQDTSNPISSSFGVAKFAITPEEGVKAFRLLTLFENNQEDDQVVVSTGELQARISKWINFETDGQPPVVTHARPTLQSIYVAPRNETEQVLAEIYQNLLGIERVGIADDFFELGGHPVLASQLIFRVQTLFRVTLPLRKFFESPTVSGLAEGLAQLWGGREIVAEIARTWQDVAHLSEEETKRMIQES